MRKYRIKAMTVSGQYIHGQFDNLILTVEFEPDGALQWFLEPVTLTYKVASYEHALDLKKYYLEKFPA